MHMTTIIPIASGKGGVGKTVCTANLGVALARMGKTVILVDLDLGGSNLHTCLGIRNNRAGIGNLIHKQEDSLESLLVETAEKRLFFVPGDSLLPGTANLSYFRKEKIIKDLFGLVADFVLIDLGAGSAYNTIDFFLCANNGLVVVVPETTSVLNAYSFIKSAIFRLIYRSFPNRSEERRIITEFSAGRLEGSDTKLGALAGLLAQVNPDNALIVTERLQQFVPRVILNMGKGTADVTIGAKLRQIARRNLEIELQYVGFVPEDPSVPRAILDRSPATVGSPSSPFAGAMSAIAERLIHSRTAGPPQLFDGDQDLDEVTRQFFESTRTEQQ